MKSEGRTFRSIDDSPDEVNVETTATMQLADGTVVTATSAVHRKVRRSDAARIKEVQEDQRTSLARTLRRLGSEAPSRRPPAADRETLLRGTAAGTRDVFDLIDDLAGRLIRWTSDGTEGIRGAVRGAAPELQRVAGRPNLQWSPGALCPLAAASGARRDDDGLKQAERDQKDPMGAALRMYARTRGLETPPERFTMESAAWAMLVVASDRGRLADWLNDQETAITADDGDRETLARTLDAITAWLEHALAPARPRRAVVEPQPADAV